MEAVPEHPKVQVIVSGNEGWVGSFCLHIGVSGLAFLEKIPTLLAMSPGHEFHTANIQQKILQTSLELCLHVRATHTSHLNFAVTSQLHAQSCDNQCELKLEGGFFWGRAFPGSTATDS